jgi:hypothetical protein
MALRRQDLDLLKRFGQRVAFIGYVFEVDDTQRGGDVAQFIVRPESRRCIKMQYCCKLL